MPQVLNSATNSRTTEISQDAVSNRLDRDRQQIFQQEESNKRINTQEHLAAAVEDQVSRPVVFTDPGGNLLESSKQRDSLDDINRAIDALGREIDVAVEGSSSQASHFRELGMLLRRRDECLDSKRKLGGGDQGFSRSNNGRTTLVVSTTIAPDGETIYANTPQHHVAVLLQQMND